MPCVLIYICRTISPKPLILSHFLRFSKTCPYRLLFDEFANIGMIPNFEKLIATIRSREISVSVILQAQSQLKAIYKDNMDTIIGNADTMLFLGGKEKTTLDEISKMLGKETIHMLNTGESRGQSASYSMNYQSLGKELMSMDEIGVMDGSKCILQVRGVRPFISTKYDIEKHHNYKYLADADPSKAFDIAAFVKVYKESRKELLEGLSKKTTKHVVIEINEDEPEKSEENPVTTPAPISDTTPAGEGITEKTGKKNEETPETQKDIDADNNEDKEHEDESDYFDPDDTELV